MEAQVARTFFLQEVEEEEEAALLASPACPVEQGVVHFLEVEAQVAYLHSIQLEEALSTAVSSLQETPTLLQDQAVVE